MNRFFSNIHPNFSPYPSYPKKTNFTPSRLSNIKIKVSLPDSVDGYSDSPNHDILFWAHNNLEIQIVIQNVN